MIVFWIRKPNIRSANQVIVWIVLVGYSWFIAERQRQKRNGSDAT
jgi:hypothetical protein